MSFNCCPKFETSDNYACSLRLQRRIYFQNMIVTDYLHNRPKLQTSDSKQKISQSSKPYLSLILNLL